MLGRQPIGCKHDAKARADGQPRRQPNIGCRLAHTKSSAVHVEHRCAHIASLNDHTVYAADHYFSYPSVRIDNLGGAERPETFAHLENGHVRSVAGAQGGVEY